MSSSDIISTSINSVIVEIEKTREDEKNGFYFDPTYKPEEHARIYGTVVAVPKKLTGRFSSIDPIVRVGDRIYFHYLIVDAEPIYGKCYKVEYDNILCLVRDSEVIPVGDWFFCQPLFDDKVEDIDLGNGTIIQGILTESGLIATTKPKASAIKAKVCFIKGYNGVGNGDIVYIEPKFEFENTIEGKDYFVTSKEWILGKN